MELANCCICGKEVTPGVDAEARFTGRTKYVCYECLADGDDQLQKHKSNYFYNTYEGRERLTRGRKKRKRR